MKNAEESEKSEVSSWVRSKTSFPFLPQIDDKYLLLFIFPQLLKKCHITFSVVDIYNVMKFFYNQRCS